MKELVFLGIIENLEICQAFKNQNVWRGKQSVLHNFDSLCGTVYLNGAIICKFNRNEFIPVELQIMVLTLVCLIFG